MFADLKNPFAPSNINIQATVNQGEAPKKKLFGIRSSDP